MKNEKKIIRLLKKIDEGIEKLDLPSYEQFWESKRDELDKYIEKRKKELKDDESNM